MRQLYSEKFSFFAIKRQQIKNRMCISYYMKEKGGVLQKLSDCFTEDGQYVDRAERRGLFSSLSKKSYGLFRMTNYRRNKIEKRIFCFFLALTMMIALLPTMALAETILPVSVVKMQHGATIRQQKH